MLWKITYSLYLDTTLTTELIEEGYAREFISKSTTNKKIKQL